MSAAPPPTTPHSTNQESKIGNSTKRRGVSLLVGDLVAFPLSWAVGIMLSIWTGKAELEWLMPLATTAGILFSVGAGLAIVGFTIHGHYRQRSPFWEEMRVVWRLLFLLALLDFSLSFFFQVSRMRIVIGLGWLLTFLMVPLARITVREILHRFKAWQLPAIVIGSGNIVEDAREAIAQEPHLGLKVAFVTSELDPATVIELTGATGCKTVVLALGSDATLSLSRLVDALQARRLEVFVVPAISGLPVQGLQAQHFLSSDTLMLRLQGSLFDPRAQRLKRGLDIVLSGLTLIACIPILLWASWRILREDGLPILYKQRRIGFGGHEFDFIKFRSMVKDADAALESWKLQKPALYAEFQENFKLNNDPRNLRCGNWMRRLSIDELPQLWNVLRGDMSLVGPRPFPQRELARLPPDAVLLYRQVRPGITGLWQVSGRSNTSFERRMELNNWYVRNWSLWLDWVVLLKTVRVVLGRHGAM